MHIFTSQGRHNCWSAVVVDASLYFGTQQCQIISLKEGEQWLLFTFAKEKRDQMLFAWVINGGLAA